MAALEAYPAMRYRIDAPSIWPRLSQIISDRDFQKIEEANNQLFFLVNSSFLALITSLSSAAAGLYQLFLWRQAIQHGLSASNPQIYQETGVAYLGGFLLSLCVFFMFYAASLPAARYYGTKYCVAFDLYRFNLLKELHLPLPLNNGDELDGDVLPERFLWRKICEHITVGDENGQIYMEYVHSNKYSVNDSSQETTQQTL